jgi:hypothetical protein
MYVYSNSIDGSQYTNALKLNYLLVGTWKTTTRQEMYVYHNSIDGSQFTNTLELNNLLVGIWKTTEWNQSINRTQCDVTLKNVTLKNS